MKRIIYIPFDHLHREFGALKEADPKNDVIAFVENARMTTGRNWHKERLFFLISSARHFAQSLTEEGFTVEYVKTTTVVDGLKSIEKKYANIPIACAEPSSSRRTSQSGCLEPFFDWWVKLGIGSRRYGSRTPVGPSTDLTFS